MKKNIRKIIAREFLLFVSTLIFVFFVYIGTIIFNYYKEVKVENISKSYEKELINRKKIDTSFSFKYRNWAFLYNSITQKYTIGEEFNDPEKLWKRFNDLLDKDSLKYKYQNVTDVKNSFRLIKLNTYDEVYDFITNNNLNAKDNENKLKYSNSSKKLRNLEITKKSLISSKLTKNDILYTIKISFIIIFTLVFPFRLFIFLIVLSIKELKN